MYSEKLIEIFKNPKNVGRVANADGIGTVGNAKCGDIMEMSIRVEDDTIVDAKFRTFGCAAAIASTSVATELIKGKTIDEALQITNADVLNVLGEVPVHKVHCSVLAQEAIEASVNDYKRKLAKREKKENN